MIAKLTPTRLRLGGDNSLFTGSLLLGALLVSGWLATTAAFAEDSSTEMQALYREAGTIQVENADQPVTLTAAQRIDGQSYQLRYNYQIPGETIRVLPGQELKVQVVNRLQRLAVATLKQLRPCVVGESDTDEVMDFISRSSNVTNLHTHGFHVSPAGLSDNVLLSLESGRQATFTFDLPPYHAPGTHWYHAHLHGATALQVQGGMAGALIVEPLGDTGLDPPGYPVRERLMVLQFGAGWENTQDNDGCESFDSGGEAVLSKEQGDLLQKLVALESAEGLRELANQLDEGELRELTESIAELQAELPPILVNGVENPVIDLAQDVEIQRLRLINAGSRNQDYKSLWIENDVGQSIPMYLAAYDGVNLTRLSRKDGRFLAYDKDHPLVLAPGNRADVYVLPTESGTFELKVEGEIGVRTDEEWTGAPEEMPLVPLRQSMERVKFRRTLMTFEVGGPDLQAKSAAVEEVGVDFEAFLVALDRRLQKLQTLPPYSEGYLEPFTSEPEIQRTITFDVDNSSGRSFLINGRDYNAPGDHGHMAGHDDYLGKHEGDGGRGPQGQTPWPLRSGTEEQWTIENQSDGRHPFHIHVSPFWVVDIVEKNENEKLVSVRETNPDDPRLDRWQDTINLPPEGGSVTVRHRVSRFDGLYVIHCHILQHEDRGMMINVLTVPNQEKDPQTYFERVQKNNDRINDEINGR